MSLTVPKNPQNSGLAIGTAIPGMKLESWDKTSYTLSALSSFTAFIYVSMYCTYCIDLLPQLTHVQEKHSNCSIFLFSTGDEEDHRSMVEYFQWNFPIFHMDQSDMEEYFRVKYLPFMMLINKTGNVVSKGVIYNERDFDHLTKKYMYN
ncbi:TlpA family protein disulfide reductase [Paenibacillus ehimensis]|uniref:TlpA family protein disulfide reductase n=1 Tax=Paenibacillus ehimensis TaxID=79264 RepID=UPI000472A1E0|nr:redoxin domain-containing protein [Paenibacillus ehimensis]